jgi:SAM-dependent methyltransferase
MPVRSTPMASNRQTAAYKVRRPLKHHEERQLAIIAERLGDFSGRMLDIGCANGKLLEALRGALPAARLAGFDLDPELVADARERLGDGVELWVGDAADHAPGEPYDALVASGVLSIFPDPLEVLDRWLGWLAPGGHLFVFGRFNSRPIDTRIEFRNLRTTGEWEGGLTSYSTQTIAEHLHTRGAEAEFERFHLPITLDEDPDDPIRTWTLELADGSRVVVNGANVVAEHHFLTVRRGA